MCITTGVCGGLIGISSAVCSICFGGIASILGIFGLLSACGLGVCGVFGFGSIMACMLGIGAVLGLFGTTIAMILGDSTIAGYLSYFQTFITQGGNLFDACRICITGK